MLRAMINLEEVETSRQEGFGLCDKIATFYDPRDRMLYLEFLKKLSCIFSS